MITKYFKRMAGGDPSPSRISHHQIAWSWLGAFIGIFCVSTAHNWLHIEVLDSLFLVGSFGASAVLIYGAPHADFSQPRNLLGGHVISAIIGISVYNYIPLNIELLSALAVSLSIVAMHYTVTLHPPGGATALIAVTGSDNIHELGYFYVVSPISIGAIIMLVVGLIMNNLSSNTNIRYPRYWL
ncbi:MAG: HPP family protein [Granulosicoccaceae bacterium]